MIIDKAFQVSVLAHGELFAIIKAMLAEDATPADFDYVLYGPEDDLIQKAVRAGGFHRKPSTIHETPEGDMEFPGLQGTREYESAKRKWLRRHGTLNSETGMYEHPDIGSATPGLMERFKNWWGEKRQGMQERKETSARAVQRLRDRKRMTRDYLSTIGGLNDAQRKVLSGHLRDLRHSDPKDMEADPTGELVDKPETTPETTPEKKPSGLEVRPGILYDPEGGGPVTEVERNLAREADTEQTTLEQVEDNAKQQLAAKLVEEEDIGHAEAMSAVEEAWPFIMGERGGNEYAQSLMDMTGMIGPGPKAKEVEGKKWFPGWTVAQAHYGPKKVHPDDHVDETLRGQPYGSRTKFSWKDMFDDWRADHLEEAGAKYSGAKGRHGIRNPGAPALMIHRMAAQHGKPLFRDDEGKITLENMLRHYPTALEWYKTNPQGLEGTGGPWTGNVGKTGGLKAMVGSVLPNLLDDPDFYAPGTTFHHLGVKTPGDAKKLQGLMADHHAVMEAARKEHDKAMAAAQTQEGKPTQVERNITDFDLSQSAEVNPSALAAAAASQTDMCVNQCGNPAPAGKMLCPDCEAKQNMVLSEDPMNVAWDSILKGRD